MNNAASSVGNIIAAWWRRLVSIQSDDAETAQLGSLFITLMVISLGVLASVASTFVAAGYLGLMPVVHAAIGVAFPVLFSTLSVICIWQAKRGHIRAMIWVHCMGNFLTIGLGVFIFGGIHGAGWMMFIWTIMIGGTLLSPVYALVMTAVVTLYAIALLVLERAGLYAAPIQINAATSAFFWICLFLIMLVSTVGLLTYFTMTSLRKTLSELRTTNARLGSEIVERNRAEAQLRQSAAVFENTQDGVMIIGMDRRILAVNLAFCEITGKRQDEIESHSVIDMMQADVNDDHFYESIWATIFHRGHWQGEIWARRKNGELFPAWSTISAVQDEAGNVSSYVAVFSDISRIKESEKKLQRLAHYDLLTDLPNRNMLDISLNRALGRAARHQHQLAVLFLDLDRFKNVNDSLGHPVGDRLLKAIAQRLTARVRNEDTLARLGGDEFVVILEHIEQPTQAAVVAQQLLDALAEPFTLSAHEEVYIGASIGISIYPTNSMDATQLIQHADAAMYRAKECGRNTFQFYTDELTESANARLALETKLRRAVERDEFEVFYQPQVSLETGAIVGAEALVRWRHPQDGMISPAKFIPLAEDTGLIVPIGARVLELACRQAQAWEDLLPASFKLSVNLSTIQFVRADLTDTVRKILDQTGLAPERLGLEITESTMMKNDKHTHQALAQFKSMGITLSIDDFGTGHSSLAYLKRFKIDVLKIDQSFVRDIPQDPNDMEIVATIIAMARNLKLSVIAEGVETREQHQFLQKNGCQAYQGFLFSPPVTAEAFAALLSETGNRDARYSALL